MANIVTNLFGDLSLDSTVKALKNVISRFTFDGSGQLRVGGNVSLPNNQALGTIAQANISIGDTGKPATAQVMSAQMFYSTVGANFARS